jgi:cytochrome c oxidase subunit IV
VLALATTLLAQFPDPGGGLPDERGGFRVSPTVFVVMLSAGFLIGAFGHMIRSRALVAIGVLLIFLSTVLVPIALHATR